MVASENEVTSLPISKVDIGGDWKNENGESVTIASLGDASYEFTYVDNTSIEKQVGTLFDWNNSHLLQIEFGEYMFLRIEISEDLMSFYSIKDLNTLDEYQFNDCQVVPSPNDSENSNAGGEMSRVYFSIYLNEQELNEMLGCSPEEFFPNKIAEFTK